MGKALTGKLYCTLTGLVSATVLSYLILCFKTTSGPEVIKLFSVSTQLSMKLFLLINVKMPPIVGILTCMSEKNNILGLTEP